MTASRDVELMARALREANGVVPPPDEVDVQRAIRAIEQAIVQRNTGILRRRRLYAALAAAAAVVGLAAGLASWRARSRGSADAVVTTAPSGNGQMAAKVGPVVGALRIEATGSSELTQGTELGAGSHVVTPLGSHAELALSTGTRLTLRESSDFRIVDTGSTEKFVLGDGAVRFDVAKLRPGERFLVDTPDAEVEVRGTSFWVEVTPQPACDNGSRTKVTVLEGIVGVRFGSLPEARVAAGTEWPPKCVAPAVPAAQAAARTAPSRPAQATPDKVASTTPAPRLDEKDADDWSSGVASTPVQHPQVARSAAGPSVASGPKPAHGEGDGLDPLAEQNALFAEALAAKRRGEPEASVRVLDRLLARYPATQLRESALAERMKILHGTGSARARRAAREYLRAYPAGFAREEANAILSEEP